MDLLELTTIRGTNPAFLNPKKCDKHPCPFYTGVPPGGYVKLGYIAYVGYELFNCLDFQMRSKHGIRDGQIYHICMLDRQNCTLYSRERMLGRG